MSVDALVPSGGERVLIVGATGGVGSYAVQHAAKRGARVIATAPTEDEDYVRDLGATGTIDYTREDVTSVIRERHPDGIEVFQREHTCGKFNISVAAAKLVRAGKIDG
jgi:NADPH2:quinone reductase